MNAGLLYTNPSSYALVTNAIRTWGFGHDGHALPDTIPDLAAALEALHGFEVQHLFVEGGARVAQEFLRQNLVDRLIIFQSPITIGAGALSPFDGIPGNFRESLSKRPIVRTASFGEDLMSVYALH